MDIHSPDAAAASVPLLIKRVHGNLQVLIARLGCDFGDETDSEGRRLLAQTLKKLTTGVEGCVLADKAYSRFVAAEVEGLMNASLASIAR
jgi:hypothetical protein